MPEPELDAVPFSLRDGWPDPGPNCTVTIRETRILLGGLLLDESEWASMRRAPVFSLRIDDHPETHERTTHHPDGTQTTDSFVIPVRPVPVPDDALADDLAFGDWATEVHGMLGRLMLWDASGAWWLTQDVDLEMALICAPDGMFSAECDELSWFSLPGVEQGKQQVEALRTRYSVGPATNEWSPIPVRQTAGVTRVSTSARRRLDTPLAEDASGSRLERFVLRPLLVGVLITSFAGGVVIVIVLLALHS